MNPRPLGMLFALLLAATVQAAAPGADAQQPWMAAGPGVMTAPASRLGANPDWEARVVLVDPAQTSIEVVFDPQGPNLGQWRKRFPDALAISNGSFYSRDPNVRPTCDLVAAGQVLRGASCHRRDALVFAAKPAAGSSAKPCMLDPSAFVPAGWSEALKGFPALVRSGVPVCAGDHYCRTPSPTAAVGLTASGQVVLFVSQWPAVRREVGRFLAESLGVQDALNLDGGPEAALSLPRLSREEDLGATGVALPLVVVVRPAPRSR